MEPDYVIHLLSRTRDRIQKFLAKELERQGIEDLSPAHAGVIYVLSRRGITAMSDLASVLDRTNATITVLLDKLEEFGYVTRTKFEEDGRVTTAELTGKGKKSVRKVISASRNTLDKLYGSLEESEKKEFLRILTKIYGNFQA
ncbi:MarR family transcriptional regulator [Leptospira fletcheri]|uniref:MarR family transcriptional regulator n=2 Tax=Leptospira fletcheri TaxID=2484981 RepID=A0A4R9GC83_9LEPT|nr:MarR family transcriptional regulator [Leptospira fletcheri]TGK08617.1 MarR family transcriptional regulator [Leptospira fletcheri]